MFFDFIIILFFILVVVIVVLWLLRTKVAGALSFSAGLSRGVQFHVRWEDKRLHDDPDG